MGPCTDRAAGARYGQTKIWKEEIGPYPLTRSAVLTESNSMNTEPLKVRSLNLWHLVKGYCASLMSSSSRSSLLEPAQASGVDLLRRLQVLVDKIIDFFHVVVFGEALHVNRALGRCGRFDE